ncbi:MAG TPA: hypothetical protein PKW49_13010, partial [Paludibacteraceae bacterium]|nr:hypothetical protein [Paludibacteraceae bacterium]
GFADCFFYAFSFLSDSNNFEKVNDKLVLKIALNKKRRAWFLGLWNHSKTFDFPCVFSNA